MQKKQKNCKYKKCVICLEHITKTHVVTQLPCNKNHQYHFDCMAKEVLEGERTQCPLCREKFCNDDLQRIKTLQLGMSYCKPYKTLKQHVTEWHEYFDSPEFAKRFIGSFCVVVLFLSTCMTHLD